MIPLHLTTTTIHVTPEQAQRLVASAVAAWLGDVPALLATRPRDADVLAVIA
jgi:hypothetical protein